MNKPQSDKQTPIVQSAKIKILKPLDRSWDEVGKRLRELAWMAPRVLNWTMAATELSSRFPDNSPNEWRSKINPKSATRPGGKLSAYQMCARAIESANAERTKTIRCSWCKGTGKEPQEPPRKRPKKQPERTPGSICSKCDAGKLREYTIGEPVDVPSAIQLGWAQFVHNKHKDDLKDLRLGKKSLASFRDTSPIVVSSGGNRFAVRYDGRGYVVDVPLWPGNGGSVTFALAPDGKRGYAHLRQMVLPTTKIGDLKILPPRQQKRGWCVAISYTCWREEVKQTEGMLIVGLGEEGIEINRPGRSARILRGLETLKRQRLAFAARRKSRSKHQRDIGRGARGHGRARALEHYHAVDDAQQRWTRSVCQEIAAKAADTAVKCSARWVLVDDRVKDYLPPAALRSAVDWALIKCDISKPKDIDIEQARLSAGVTASGEGAD